MKKTFSEWLERLLKRMFPDRVTFSDGSYVEYFNREAVLYGEMDGHQMEIIWVFDPKKIKARILRRTDIDRWDSPHESDPVDDRKKAQVESRIIEYCQRKGINLEVT